MPILFDVAKEVVEWDGGGIVEGLIECFKYGIDGVDVVVSTQFYLDIFHPKERGTLFGCFSLVVLSEVFKAEGVGGKAVPECFGGGVDGGTVYPATEQCCGGHFGSSSEADRFFQGGFKCMKRFLLACYLIGLGV